MKKLIIGMLSLFVVALFLVSCAPEMSDEELEAELNSLSAEELDAVFEEDSAVSGQAVRSPRVSKARKAAKKIEWISCTDSDGGKNFDVAGKVNYKYSYYGKSRERTLKDRCYRRQLIEYYCKSNRYAKTTINCEFGCSAGACTSPTLVVNLTNVTAPVVKNVTNVTSSVANYTNVTASNVTNQTGVAPVVNVTNVTNVTSSVANYTNVTASNVTNQTGVGNWTNQTSVGNYTNQTVVGNYTNQTGVGNYSNQTNST